MSKIGVPFDHILLVEPVCVDCAQRSVPGSARVHKGMQDAYLGVADAFRRHMQEVLLSSDE
eukprot:1950895-Amphidinium_carterae.1